MIYLEIPSIVLDNHYKYMCQDFGSRKCLKTYLTKIQKKCENPTVYKEELKAEYSRKIHKKSKKNKEVIKSIDNYYLKNFKNVEIKAFGEILEKLILDFDKLIIGNIDDLIRINKEFEESLVNLIPDNGIFRVYVKKFIGEKFLNSYANFTNGGYISKDKIWSRIEYVDSFKLNVCPYCNANFILTIKSSNQIKKNNRKDSKGGESEDILDDRRGTSPELDHFHPKDKYPLLSMSAYNLVPSCKICNQSFKGNIDFNFEEFYSPFEKGIDNSFHFYRKLNNEKSRLDDREHIIQDDNNEDGTPDYVNVILGYSNDFTIDIEYKEKLGYSDEENNRLKNKVLNNVINLGIRDVYNFHKPFLQKLFVQYQIYNEIYKTQLELEFPQLFPELDKYLNSITPIENYKDIILSKMVSEIITEEILLGSNEEATSLLVKLRYEEPNIN